LDGALGARLVGIAFGREDDLGVVLEPHAVLASLVLIDFELVRHDRLALTAASRPRAEGCHGPASGVKSAKCKTPSSLQERAGIHRRAASARNPTASPQKAEPTPNRATPDAVAAKVSTAASRFLTSLI